MFRAKSSLRSRTRFNHFISHCLSNLVPSQDLVNHVIEWLARNDRRTTWYMPDILMQGKLPEVSKSSLDLNMPIAAIIMSVISKVRIFRRPWLVWSTDIYYLLFLASLYEDPSRGRELRRNKYERTHVSGTFSSSATMCWFVDQSSYAPFRYYDY